MSDRPNTIMPDVQSHPVDSIILPCATARLLSLSTFQHHTTSTVALGSIVTCDERTRWGAGALPDQRDLDGGKAQPVQA